MRALGNTLRALGSLALPVVAALLLGAALVAVLGENPWMLYKTLWFGAFGSVGNTLTTLRWATPLILSGLAVTVAYRVGYFNMGADGQIYAGALAAALVGASWSAPMWVHLPAAFLAAALAGAVFVLVPMLLRVLLGVNEIVTTLMFNYIGFLLTDYIVLAIYFGGDSAKAVLIQTPRVAATATISRFVAKYPLTWAIFVSVGIAVIAWLVLRKTVWGYAAESVGSAPGFAKYVGINVKKVAGVTFLISGAIAGIAGGMEILGTNRRFVSQFSTGIGFEGIIVALLGRTDPLGMIVGGLFLAAIKNGFFAVERAMDIDRSVATVLQALILLFVSARTIIDILERRRPKAVGEPTWSK